MLRCFFFFKQKTAYEMRISDWSSDVCSSDLGPLHIDSEIAAAAQSTDFVEIDSARAPQRRIDIEVSDRRAVGQILGEGAQRPVRGRLVLDEGIDPVDRKSTRLNSSH